ncbi:diguanylate cyclase [Ideonella sp. 4Y11]|uniref:diguanylate cyclase n=1 Tax=Ideonella aquatica TaxID=2824119 RepID=A0A941BL77_9BURK|nr:diguanylate cyclase [Ideonella aquatica]MBQ0960673.1 diguanylate cyclase [Ideonella aquatica]
MTVRPILRRLAVRQALLAALLGLLLGAVFSLLQVRQDYDRSLEEERQDILQMLAVMREPAAQACYNLNPQAAAVIVQGALSYLPVQQARLLNDFGEVLALGRNAQLETAGTAWWARFVPATQDYSLSLEYGPARQRVGQLSVVTAQAPRIERFLARAWRDAGLTVLRSVSVALALGAVSFLTLTRPLSSIARRIVQGPPTRGDAAIPEAQRVDEIGEIAAAFERHEREAEARAQGLEASARALAASEARYRRVVETASEGVWKLDPQGRTVLANGALARMMGSTVELMMGRSVYDFFDDADRPLAEALMARQQGQSTLRREVRLRRADGQVLWADVSTCSIADEDGPAAGTLAMVTDATERRRRDDELRAGHARLVAMVGDLERHNTDMTQIAELNQLLQSARSETEAHEVIRAAAERLFGGGSGGFALPGAGEDMQVHGRWGRAVVLPDSYPRDACWAIRRGRLHRHEQGQGVRCAHQAEAQPPDMLCLPLYVEGELLGVLHLCGDAASPDKALQQRGEIFGEVVKLGLSNLRLRLSLREQALRDALTGLPNRRLFDETLPRELARCQRAGEPLTLAVVDVDHFKRFNDRYGHEAGDRVLCAVAQALLASIRASDLAARYGGDEFMCLLPGMSADDARRRFEAALARVSGERSMLPDPADAVTFTVGLASAPAHGIDALALMHAADAALYRAKERGRNGVEVAAGSVSA